MKKVYLLFILMVLSAFAVFAEEDDDEDEHSGVVISLASTYCNPSVRLDSFNYSNNSFDTLGFAAEAGFFNSDEDGLIDIITDNVLGVKFGTAFTDGEAAFSYDGYTFAADADAKYGSIYSRDDIGIQLNLFLLSFGATIGLRGGYDLLYQSAALAFGNPLSIYENTFFLDFVTGSYVAVNLGSNLKLMFNFNIDAFSIVKVTIDTVHQSNGRNDTDVGVKWFGPIDNDLSFAVSAVLFF